MLSIERETMPSLAIPRPAADEYDPYYAKYVSLVPDGDLVKMLSTQIEKTSKLLNAVAESKAGFRYAPGKWSIKEVVGHLSDSERIFSYRALRFARADTNPLPGFEQDDYVKSAGFDARLLADLLDEFRAVRQATVTLLKSFDEEALRRRGVASDKPISVRALAYNIAGHELHHGEILRTRYLIAA
jgi:uncharacterized damage-inducible protein DinB